MDANIQLIPSPLMAYNSTKPVNTYNITLTDGVAQNVQIPSNLPTGTAPSWMRLAMICTTADGNFAVGDEIDACYIMDGSNLGTYCNSPLACGSNAAANKVYISFNGTLAGNFPGLIVASWKGANSGISSFSNFSAKLYWQ